MNTHFRTSFCLSLLALGGLAAAVGRPLAAQEIPQFTVELVPLQFGAGTPVPALHSFARAVGSQGEWLVLTGRTNGLHTFPSSPDGATPSNAFPTQQANARLWVIDPVKKTVSSAALPASGSETLTVTNAVFAQDGDTLYVAGGYGARGANMQTFPTITAIPVKATIAAIQAGQALPAFPQVNVWYDCLGTAAAANAACSAGYGAPGLPKCGDGEWKSCACQPGPDWHQCMQNQLNSCKEVQAAALASCNLAIVSGNLRDLKPSNTGPSYVTVTGGEMERVGQVFWVMLGQNFQGLYSADPVNYGTWPVSQVYTRRMVALHLGQLGGQLSAAVLNQLQGDDQWNRRDLNVEPALDTDGSPMLAVYGGVFVPGRMDGYQQPIYLKGGNHPLTATTELDPYQQLFSLYDCATLKLWSAKQKLMQTVFFGGIGLYYLSASNGVMHKDSGLPFVSTLSVLSRDASGVTSEVYARQPLPALMGADANFFPNPGAPRHQEGEILALDQVSSRTLAGWIYGGLLASEAHPSRTGPGAAQASSAIYEVWITPTAPADGYWNPADADDEGVLKSRR